MIVSGLTRVGSTRRSLSWPADQREPAPEKSGASVPWNFSSGNGPVWHRRQAPSRRSATIARPRAGSPPVPVSDAGIASPRTAKGRNGPSSAIAATPAPARSAAASTASGEGLGRDRAEPGFGIAGFEGTEMRRRVDRAHPARTLDIGELAIDRMVDAGNRDPVIRCDKAVTGVDQLRRRWSLATQQRGDRKRTDLGLSIGGKRRFRHGAGNRSIADDVD